VKILIYGVNYAPELTGIGKYTGKMAKWLAEQGHDVRVVTAPPYYPEWQVEKSYSGTRYSKENMHGVDIWRCPLYVPQKPSGLKRMIHLASFACTSLPVMVRQMFWKPDVVWIVEPPLFCAPTAWAVARLSGGKCWLHVQDFEVDAAFDLGILPFAWMKRWVSAAESWLMRRFDVVSTISQSMMVRLEGKGVTKPVFFPNWANLSQMKYDDQGRQIFRAELGVRDEECLCLYSGNIAVKQGLDIVLDAAVRLPDIRFVICGSGANKAQLKSRAQKMRLENVQFLPLQSLEKFAPMLSATDIHLVIQKKGAADLVMPSKLTNILAVGGVALATAEADSELGQLAVGDDACLYRCDPEDKALLVDAIRSLSLDQLLRAKLKKAAKAYALAHIDKMQVLKSFDKQLNNLAE